MSIKAVLFDLDGTLLPMDQDNFMTLYFKALSTKLAPYGYDPKKLTEDVWAGTVAMINNSGAKTNEEVFWDFFTNRCGENVKDDLPLFDEFYRNEFIQAKAACDCNPMAAEAIAQMKDMGLRLALATNPLFPEIATFNRIHWAGLSPEDFEFYTTYEDSYYCKPNPKYYEEVVARMNLKAEECLMVGNDVSEDMIAETLGMKVFLLTDCLINKKKEDINKYPHGGFLELIEFVKRL